MSPRKKPENRYVAILERLFRAGYAEEITREDLESYDR
jgi:hypothetical protein